MKKAIRIRGGKDMPHDGIINRKFLSECWMRIGWVV
jgi:hypothetical protein